MFAAAFVALYEQSLPRPNVIIMAVAICIFMLGLMKLMSKVPGKNDSNNNDDEV